MRRKSKIILISVAIVVLLALVILPKINFSGSEEDTAAGRITGAFPVKAHVIKHEKLANNVLTSGTILANEEVELRSEIPGKIIRILFKEGTRVSKGDVLVKINDAELQPQLERARYNRKLLESREYRQRILLEKQAISQE
jgi:membrane fusion protein (multidrug efflux system)